MSNHLYSSGSTPSGQQPPYQTMAPYHMPPPPYPFSPGSGAMTPQPMVPMPFPTGPGREESFVENILRMNLGKMATIYMTFENNSQWNAKIFKGRLEAAGRDHIIISDPETNERFLLLMVNLDYIVFEGPLQYNL